MSFPFGNFPGVGVSGAGFERRQFPLVKCG